MSVILQAYLNFPGTTREALGVYREIFGGELTLNTFGEFQAVPADHAAADLVMHSELVTPYFTINGADTVEGMHEFVPGNNVNLALMGQGQEAFDTLSAAFDRLAEGGEVEMALQQQMWGDHYGAVIDRFGIHWMVNVGGLGD